MRTLTSSSASVREAFEPSRTLALEEVSVRIERDLVREGEEQAVIDWVEAAMAGYEVRRS